MDSKDQIGDGLPSGLSIENPDVSGVPTLAEGMEKCGICCRDMKEGEVLHHGEYNGQWVNACDDCEPALDKTCHLCGNGLYLGKALVWTEGGELTHVCHPCLNIKTEQLRCYSCRGSFDMQPVLNYPTPDDKRLARGLCTDCADKLGDKN